MKNTIHFMLIALVFTFTQAQAGSSVWDKSIEAFDGPNEISVYRDPDCGCCKDWINHLKKHNFNVIDIPSKNMSAIKQKFNVPQDMASCHTATIGGYLVEGHVPANDIKKLLNTRPDIAGLSVPKMPVGPPGMERGQRKDPFAVMKFRKSGQFDSFKEYRFY